MSVLVNPAKLAYPKLLTPLADVEGPHRAFRKFCKLAACAVSMGKREEEYMREIQGLSAGQLTAVSEALGRLVMEMEERPYTDLLGPYYQHISSPYDREFRGEFYTPPEVSRLLSDLTLPEEWPEGHLRIQEPAAGSGGVLLSVVERMAERKIAPDRVYMEAWDLSEGACDMAYINLTLHGVPATVIWANTLRMEVFASWSTVFRPAESSPASLDWSAAFGKLEKLTAVPAVPGEQEFVGTLFGEEIA